MLYLLDKNQADVAVSEKIMLKIKMNLNVLTVSTEIMYSDRRK